MKFGKRILAIAAEREAYRSYYLDYKGLKRLLKRLRELAGQDLQGTVLDGADGPVVEQFSSEILMDIADAEESFVLALQGEFAKVESFFRSKLAEFLAVFRCLCKRFGKLKNLSLSGVWIVPSTYKDLGARLQNHPTEEELVTEMLDLVEDVDALRGFVMTNAQALVKICKKHDKCSTVNIKDHFMRVLRRCTFFGSREFGGLVADINLLAVEVFTKFTGKNVARDAFHCEICAHVLCNPLELSCGHRFCVLCVPLDTFFGEHRCPVCFRACLLSEERTTECRLSHLRVQTLHSYLQRLIDDNLVSHGNNSQFDDKVSIRSDLPDVPSCSSLDTTAPAASQAMNGTLEPSEVIRPILSQAASEPNLVAWSKGTLTTSGSLNSISSEPAPSPAEYDVAISEAETVAPSRGRQACSIELPCASCQPRSHHVIALRAMFRGAETCASETSTRLSKQGKHLTIGWIIKSNDERQERERRISMLSATSATSSAANLSDEFSVDPITLRADTPEFEAAQADFDSIDFSVMKHVAKPVPTRANKPALAAVDIALSPLHLEGTLEETDEPSWAPCSPWSPSKRWTACSEIFLPETGLKRQDSWGVGCRSSIERTSSFSFALAQDMWGKLHAMEARAVHDRRVRIWLWLLELFVLLVTIVLCIRVGSPELLCPDLDDELSPRDSLYPIYVGWQFVVCGSWGGLLTPAGTHAVSDEKVGQLQAERTRSLHIVLDKLVKITAK